MSIYKRTAKDKKITQNQNTKHKTKNKRNPASLLPRTAQILRKYNSNSFNINFIFIQNKPLRIKGK